MRSLPEVADDEICSVSDSDPRHEDSAGKAAPQRQSRDALSRAKRPDAPGDDCERRLVERRRLHTAELGEDRVETDNACQWDHAASNTPATTDAPVMR